MEKYFEIIKSMTLFQSIETKELPNLLKCLSSNLKKYKKGEFIFRIDQEITSIGAVMSGSVQIIKEDAMGNRMIMAQLHEGQLFAEVFSCAKISKIPVSVVATEDSEILFLSYNHIINTCSSACSFHAKLIENMLKIIANKNILLNQKIDCISRRTTREKIITYLFSESQKANQLTFKIPFNRQELADYLCVDRSAMSNELCKLRDEGVIKFHRSNFELLGALNID